MFNLLDSQRILEDLDTQNIDLKEYERRRGMESVVLPAGIQDENFNTNSDEDICNT